MTLPYSRQTAPYAVRSAGLTPILVIDVHPARVPPERRGTVSSMPTISLPAQLLRTRRFTLGVPEEFTVASHGSVVLFLRSRADDDPMACQWALNLDTRTERLLADPADLLRDSAQAVLPRCSMSQGPPSWRQFIVFTRFSSFDPVFVLGSSSVSELSHCCSPLLPCRAAGPRNRGHAIAALPMPDSWVGSCAVNVLLHYRGEIA